MKKIIYISLLLLILGINLFAQNSKTFLEKRKTGSVNMTLFGNGSILSWNIEKLFIANKNMMIAAQFGLGYMIEPNQNSNEIRKFLTIPAQLTLNIGKGRHFAEIGLGGTITNSELSGATMLYPIVGYRIQPINNEKYNFRIYGGFPIYGLMPTNYSFVPFGMSLGICF